VRFRYFAESGGIHGGKCCGHKIVNSVGPCCWWWWLSLPVW